MMTSRLNDSFEFEVTFYDKSSATQLLMLSSGSSSLATSGVRVNTGIQMGKDLCSRVYEGCVSSRTRTKNSNESIACMIASPGYPGVYPKNSKCQFFVRGSYADESVPRGTEKLLLINDNLQLDATICHFKPGNR